MNIALTGKSTLSSAAESLCHRLKAEIAGKRGRCVRERGETPFRPRQGYSEKSEWNREFFTRLLIAFMHQEAVFTFPAAQLGISRE